MSALILSLTMGERRVLSLFAALLTAMALLFGLSTMTAQTESATAQTTPYYYEAVDLGTLPGGTNSVPYGINNAGQVVGAADTESGEWHAFLYDESATPKMQDLGTLGGSRSSASSINDAGQVVGYSEVDGDQNSRAFLYEDGQMQPLGDPLPGDITNYAAGINGSGQIVGNSQDSSGYSRAFLYDESATPKMKDLGTLGGDQSYAQGINDPGQVVGDADKWNPYGNSHPHAFLYSGGRMKDLGDLGDGSGHSQANSINASGQVVGWSTDSSGNPFHAFLYSGGKMQDLGSLGPEDGYAENWANDINDSGQIVGHSYNSDDGFNSAFLYQNGEMIDLSTRLLREDPGVFWYLYGATSINNDGLIVVDSWRETEAGEWESHALLLKPRSDDIPLPPDTVIDSGPPEIGTSDSATFEFHATEEGSTFECSLDGYYWTECSSPTSYDDLADGGYTFKVRAIGAGGGVDDSPASQSWQVDSREPSAPTIYSFCGSCRNNTYDSDGSFSITGGSEAGSTVELFEDTTSKGTTTADSSYYGSWSIDLSGVSEGSHTYFAKAKDAAGNTSSASNTITVTVDKTAPTVSTLKATSVSNSGVPLRKTDFQATFSEKMDTGWLDTYAFKLFKCSSAKDTACTTEITDKVVTPSADGLSATLNPFGSKSTLLQSKTKYKVEVTTTAYDVVGNALDQDASRTGNQEKVEYFTTGTS